MSDRAPSRDAWLVALVALVARLAVVGWAAPRFGAAGDGEYYDALARRLAAGDGYTWAWPDGAVTYAAHYPVGYPALLGLAYRLLGASTLVAMLVNAMLGAAAAGATHRLLAERGGRRAAVAGALVVALHPALLPYTAAIMTEGVTAALLTVAAALGVSARTASRPGLVRAAAGAVLGVATLVRPQCIVLSPVLGALAWPAEARLVSRLRGAAAVTLIALACCAPWTARNCVRMHRCALVSVNGGWNLLIGARTASGAWAPLDVPDECRTVWEEAAKDACFERVARREIASAPRAFAGRIGSKLAATFDYFGAAPWYLHLANPAAFGDRAKTVLGAFETVWSRVVLFMAMLAVARYEGPRARARALLLGAAAIAAFTVHGWIAYVALGLAPLLLGWRALGRAPVVVPWMATVLLTTAAVHAAFFGAGRYGLVVAPFVAAVAFVRRRPMPPLVSESQTSSPSSRSSSVIRAV